MSPKAVFISDIHLKSGHDGTATWLLRVLDAVASRGFSHLFLLGDIFDLWIADHDYFYERFKPVLEKLHSLRSQGVEIHYFEGNHDLDLKPFFQKKLGAIVHENAVSIDFAGRKLRLEHGDQMDPSDRDYLFLRWLLRTPVIRWLGRHLPSPIVRWIGVTASKTSRTYTTGVHRSIGHEAVEAKQITHAEKVYNERPFDLLIAGHVHVLLDIKLPNANARLINLGTWLDKPHVFELTNGEAALKSVESFLRTQNI